MALMHIDFYNDFESKVTIEWHVFVLIRSNRRKGVSFDNANHYVILLIWNSDVETHMANAT